MPNNPLDAINVDKNISKGAVEKRLPKPLMAEIQKELHADLSQIKIMQSHLPTLNGSATFNIGNEIHFAPGSLQPHTKEGKELIAHELSHVVQQRGGSQK